MQGQIFSPETMNIRGRMVFDESRLSRSIYMERVQKVSACMKERQLDALIAAGKDLSYLTGLLLPFVWFPGRNDYCLLTSSGKIAVKSAVGPRDIIFLKTQTWVDDLASSNDPIVEIANLIKSDPSIKRIGLSDISERLRSHDYVRLKKELEGKELVQDDCIRKIREVKDVREVDLIWLASKSLDVMYETILRNAVAGSKLYQVEAKADRMARLEGARDVRVLWHSAINGHGALTMANETVISKGDIIASYLACEYQGYWAESGRCFAIGEPLSEYEDMYRAALRALSKGEDILKSGTFISSVFKEILESLRSSGYHEHVQWDYGFGHGIGLSTAEEPYINVDSKKRLEDGMVISLRIPLYKPKVGLVLVGDTLKISEGSAVRLTKSSLELESI